MGEIARGAISASAALCLAFVAHQELGGSGSIYGLISVFWAVALWVIAKTVSTAAASPRFRVRQAIPLLLTAFCVLFGIGLLPTLPAASGEWLRRAASMSFVTMGVANLVLWLQARRDRDGP